MDYFFDSSALVKRFAQETGSEWVDSLCSLSDGHNIYIAAVTGAEVIAALKRRESVGTSEARTEAIQQFRNEFTSRYHIIEITLDIVSLAMVMAEEHSLRHLRLTLNRVSFIRHSL